MFWFYLLLRRQYKRVATYIRPQVEQFVQSLRLAIVSAVNLEGHGYSSLLFWKGSDSPNCCKIVHAAKTKQQLTGWSTYLKNSWNTMAECVVTSGFMHWNTTLERRRGLQIRSRLPCDTSTGTVISTHRCFHFLSPPEKWPSPPGSTLWLRASSTTPEVPQYVASKRSWCECI